MGNQNVVDAAAMFGSMHAAASAVVGQKYEPLVDTPIVTPPADASDRTAPVTTSTQTDEVNLDTITAQLRSRLDHIHSELQKLEALDAERRKLERLLAAIGD